VRGVRSARESVDVLFGEISDALFQSPVAALSDAYNGDVYNAPRVSADSSKTDYAS
jgi:hypothetical protein